MTVLEEIKKPLEGRDIATLTNVELVTEISRLLSTLESLQLENERLQAEIARKSSMPGDHRYWEGRYRDEAAENEKLREALTGLVSCHDDFNASSGNMEEAYYKLAKYAYPKWEAARASLASTGGEHHADK